MAKTNQKTDSKADEAEYEVSRPGIKFLVIATAVVATIIGFRFFG